MRPIIPFLNFMIYTILGVILVIYANRSPDTMVSHSDMSDSNKVACVSGDDLSSLAPNGGSKIGGCSGTQYGCCPNGITAKNEDGSNCGNNLSQLKCFKECSNRLNCSGGSSDRKECLESCKKECSVIENYEFTAKTNEHSSNSNNSRQFSCMNQCGKIYECSGDRKCLQNCKENICKIVENYSNSGPGVLPNLRSAIKNNNENIQNVKNASLISGSLLLVMAFLSLVHLIHCLRHSQE